MSTDIPSSPLVGSNGYVPWQIYLEDRRQIHGRFDRIEAKLDKVLDAQAALAVEAALDDGAEVAQDAADRAVKEGRKDRAERLWDIARTVIATVLAVLGTLITTYLVGGPPA